MRKLAIIITFLLLLVSCSTLDKGSAPAWISSEPRILGSTVFVGRGEGPTRETARTDSYDNVLAKMGEMLGRNLSTLYLRELLSRKSISDLSTSVEDEYIYKENDKYIGYVMTVTPNRVFNDSRSPEYLALLDREGRIKDKIDESIALYSENRDIDAIDSLLDAVLIAAEGSINNPDYSKEALRDKAILYISRIRITAENKRKAKDECTIRVKRDKGLFSPAVVSGYIESRYNAVNSDGALTSEYFISKTDKKGRFTFKRTNPYVLFSSSFSFLPYLDKEKLDKIERSTDKDFLAPLYEALDKVKLSYDYRRKADLSSWAVSLSAYDLNGNLLNKDTIFAPLNNQMKLAGIDSFNAIEGYGEESIEDYEVLSRVFSDRELYFVLRSGVVDIAGSAGRSYVRIDSSLTIYDGEGNEIKTRAYSVTGIGESFKDAESDGFSRVARLSADFFLEEL